MRSRRSGDPGVAAALRPTACALALATLLGCETNTKTDAKPSPADGVAPQVALIDAFPALQFNAPIALLQPPGDATRWYVVERGGTVRWFSAADPTTLNAYASLTVNTTGEGGLLGMAFHPDYPETRDAFLSYTVTSSPLRSIVARYPEVNGALDTSAPTIVLQQEQPFTNHNGGAIVFGPDGYLYIALGDGGGGGDPQGNGQSLATWLGKLLRIDVDGGTPYAVPPDNPFTASQNGALPEIYAYGFRNPWRFSFDRETGGLWLADVGQGNWEEVDRVVPGGNYGWNVMEGAHCYSPPSDCNRTGLTLPAAEYSHTAGCSISGGYVYRGTALPVWQGHYFYGDFCSGMIWALPAGGGAATVVAHTSLRIVGFAEGADGELYVLDFEGGRAWRLASAP